MRSNWWADGLGPLLVGAVEGSWVLVLYELFETVGHGPALLTLPVFVAVAFLGALATTLAPHGAPRWGPIVVATAGVAGVGMLVAPGVLAAVVAVDPERALGAHPGGWLLGLAAFRGLLGGGAVADPDDAGAPLARGLIVLTIAWLYAGLLPVSSQAAFRTAAIGPTLLFATTGMGAAALRRVQAVTVPAGIPWWRNRVWLLGLAAALALLALVAVPVADALMTVVPGIMGLAGFTELLAVAIALAWLVVPKTGPRRPRGSVLRGLVGVAILAVIGAIAYELLHPNTTPNTAAGRAAVAAQSTEANGVVGVVIVLAILGVIVLLALLAASKWRRGTPRDPTMEARDEAAFEVDGPGLEWLRRPWRRLRRGRAGVRPASAEAAYVATLGLLEGRPETRRLPQETPAAHAQRLHREGGGSLELDLLAADYELSRWGARRLPVRETRRAIGRWERARAWIATAVAADQAAREFADVGERSGRR